MAYTLWHPWRGWPSRNTTERICSGGSVSRRPARSSWRMSGARRVTIVL